MPSQLTQLVYYSKAVDQEKMDVKGLLETAVRRNQSNFITGALWLYGEYFLQVLEGERTVVSETFLRICKDGRHEGVVLVGCKEISEREFADWWMALALETPRNRQNIIRFSGTDRLHPDELTHERIVKILKQSDLSRPDVNVD